MLIIGKRKEGREWNDKEEPLGVLQTSPESTHFENCSRALGVALLGQVTVAIC